MKVSIIIPVYNCENYLADCLDSLVNQTLKNIEILAVDDGSTDTSGAILEDYAKRYPVVKVYHKENGGQASARNFALSFAQGDFLGFVDSDDWVDTNLYENMVNIAEQEEADIVVCDMYDHYPDRLVHHEASKFLDKFHQTPSACNKLFRRTLIRELDFPQGYWYEDFCYTTKALFLSDRIARCHEGGYHCHCRQESTMTNHNSPKNLDILYVMDELIRFTEERGIREKYENELQYLILDHILITSINRVALHNNEKKKEVITSLQKYVQQNCPHLLDTAAYRELPRNRRIIAYLNAKGLWRISRIILNLNQKTHKKLS